MIVPFHIYLCDALAETDDVGRSRVLLENGFPRAEPYLLFVLHQHIHLFSRQFLKEVTLFPLEAGLTAKVAAQVAITGAFMMN